MPLKLLGLVHLWCRFVEYSSSEFASPLVKLVDKGNEKVEEYREGNRRKQKEREIWRERTIYMI